MKPLIPIYIAILIFSFVSCGKPNPLNEDADALAKLHCDYINELNNTGGDLEKLKSIQNNFVEYISLKDSLQKKYTKDKDQLTFFKRFNEQVAKECGTKDN